MTLGLGPTPQAPARTLNQAGQRPQPTLVGRTWVLLTEASDGGWGPAGHAHTNEELVTAARAQVAGLQAGKPAADDAAAYGR